MFDLDALVWDSVKGDETRVQTKFPWARFEAFVVAEQNKGCCTFTTEHCMRQRTLEELLAAEPPIAMRSNTRLFQSTWRCVFGGKPKLRRSSELGAGAIPPAPEGKHRRSKSANGESIKEPGCLCK